MINDLYSSLGPIPASVQQQLQQQQQAGISPVRQPALSPTGYPQGVPDFGSQLSPQLMAQLQAQQAAGPGTAGASGSTFADFRPQLSPQLMARFQGLPIPPAPPTTPVNQTQRTGDRQFNGASPVVLGESQLTNLAGKEDVQRQIQAAAQPGVVSSGQMPSQVQQVQQVQQARPIQGLQQPNAQAFTNANANANFMPQPKMQGLSPYDAAPTNMPTYGNVPTYGGGQFNEGIQRQQQQPQNDWQSRFQQIMGQNWPAQQQATQQGGKGGQGYPLPSGGGKGGSSTDTPPRQIFGSNNNWS